MTQICIIGGGPAGLMAAETLATAGLTVDLFDAMPTVGRKFLMAGKGGMNITHAEAREPFLARYGGRTPQLTPMIDAFDPAAIRHWMAGLGIESFIGSSGRIFPKEMKAAPLLRAWLQRLRRAGVRFHLRHRWLGWTEDDALRFATPTGEQTLRADATILALGGGSWARLGSDGRWVAPLTARGIAVAPLLPTNCGFDVEWSTHFRERFAGMPVKPLVLSFTPPAAPSLRRQGELVITHHGVEGGAIYALSAPLREALAQHGSATLLLDLAPGREPSALASALAKPRGKRSLAGHLRRCAGIEGVQAGLLRERLAPEVLADPLRLASAIKALPLPLKAPRPLDEAISSAGGVLFEELDAQLMVRSRPGLFCAGEMLDWEAPTGGYLLTAVLASGRAAGQGVLTWLARMGHLSPPPDAPLDRNPAPTNGAGPTDHGDRP